MGDSSHLPGHMDISGNKAENSNQIITSSPTVNIYGREVSKKKILWGIGIAITIIVISIAVPLEEVNRNHDMSTTSSSSPTSSMADTATQSRTIAMLTTTTVSTQPSSPISTSVPSSLSVLHPSPTSTAAPPQITADGMYLVNYNSSSDSSIKGSGLAYYKNMSLEENVGHQPDDYADITTDYYTMWEDQTRTGYFIDSNITFRAFVNASIDTAASMPVNSPIGNASNFDISGNLDRTFLVYRGSGGMLYQSNNDDCQYYMDYYAA